MNDQLDHNELDQLLRQTLTGRAATVTDGAEWRGAPTRRSRTPWLAAAAAAVTVLGVSGGVAYLGHGSGLETPTGGAPTRATCNAPLPPQWVTAVERGELTYRGTAVLPYVVTPSDAVIGFPTEDTSTLVVVPKTGPARRLLTTPRDHSVVAVDADADQVVVNSVRATSKTNIEPPIDRITVVDIATGVHSDLLEHLPPSTPRFVLDKQGARIQDGQVYWLAGSSPAAGTATVMSYDIKEHRYSVVGHAATPELDRDVRGVGWVGGSVPAPNAPSGVPSFFSRSGHYQPVFSDGRTATWQDDGSPEIIHVRDHDGRTTAWRVDPDHGGLKPTIQAASGNYVFFGLNDSGYTGYVLDIRTGATVYLTYGAERTVDVSYPSFVTVHGVLLATDNDSVGRRLDPSKLPAPHC